jgi:hypothetical protein
MSSLERSVGIMVELFEQIEPRVALQALASDT